MIGTIDTIISCSYLLAIVGIGLWVGLRKRKTPADGGSGEYFLAGRSLRWPMIGLALFATNISCIHLVSLAQSGFDTGLLNGNFEWMAAFTLILLALFFVPFYLRSNVTTLPDFLEKRYNAACRNWLSVVSIISAVVIHIAFSFLAGGIVLKTLFGVNMYLSVVLIALLTGLYTILGGLRAVVVTESIQTIVLLAGAFIITVICYQKAGGWEGIHATLKTAGDLDKLSMLRSGADKSGMPWYAVFLGYPVLGIWYWCADQTIVQRVLGAKDENHARVGSLFCGFIKILPVFIFVLPGLMAYVLAKKGLFDISAVQQLNAAGETVTETKGIYTLMITQLVPTGLVGILVAALLSGLMSQISGALNSIATLASFDLYKQVRRDATDRQLVRAGKITAGIALAASIALLPLLNRYESLFNGINDVIAHIAPPITTVFLFGIFWKKASAIAAQLTLWIGSVAGALVFLSNKLFPQTLFAHTPFLLVAFYLFVFCSLMMLLFSLLFPVIHNKESENLCWSSPWEPLKGKAWKGLGNYRFLTGLLLLIMVILYAVFQ